MHIKEIILYNWDNFQQFKNSGKIQLTSDTFEKIKNYELIAIQCKGVTTLILSKDDKDEFSAVANSANNLKSAFDKIEIQMKERENEFSKTESAPGGCPIEIPRDAAVAGN